MSTLHPMIHLPSGGYIRHTRTDGTDLDVVNAARASFEKEVFEMGDGDRGLIDFLAVENHDSPFRQVGICYESHESLLIARQAWRYCVGAANVEDATGWNEASRRYVTLPPAYARVEAWRVAPANRKQGSGGAADAETQRWADETYARLGAETLAAYDEALERGICPEQARFMLLGYALMTTWRTRSSLAGIVHQLRQRLAKDAQKEWRPYAEGLAAICIHAFPISTAALLAPRVILSRLDKPRRAAAAAEAIIRDLGPDAAWALARFIAGSLDNRQPSDPNHHAKG
ncbi:MAG: FAD-dependent thymidylate synthase [Sumerlaeia bacterium]